jgi:aryl-alcohol dehydrogenase-like predicted oxidoreductase
MTKPSLSAAAAGTIGIGDLTVNRMGFGAMRITGPGIWGDPPDREEAKAVLRRAVELDVNFIDTADSYGPEVSESLIAEALQPYPPGLVIATKGGLERPGPDRWTSNGRPEHLRDACEASLKRLGVEQIAVYQLHRPDPKVPLEDSIGALVELKAQGKIRHIGVSNVSKAQLERARRLTDIVSVQNRYNVDDRASDAVVELCEKDGLAFIPWAPVHDLDANPALRKLAQDRGVTPHQVGLAWLLKRSPAMVPIPGTASVAHLEENVAAAAIELTEQELSALSGSSGGKGRPSRRR